MVALFEDSQVGGFYLTGSDVPALFIRTRPDYDGAVPNGNSIAAENLIRLAELTGDQKWFKHGEKILAFYQQDLKTRPASLTQLLSAADLWLGSRSEIVIAAPQAESANEMLREIRNRFLPRTVVLLRTPETHVSLLEEVAETIKGRTAIDGKLTIYLCEDFVCKQPMIEEAAFLKALGELR